MLVSFFFNFSLLICLEKKKSKNLFVFIRIRSSFKWNSPPYDVPDMFSKPGTPCNNYNGYCDVFQKCREVDPSGPLATLRKLLLSEESLATFRQWTIEHWYAVAFLCLAAILFVVSLNNFSVFFYTKNSISCACVFYLNFFLFILSFFIYFDFIFFIIFFIFYFCNNNKFLKLTKRHCKKTPKLDNRCSESKFF